MGNQIIYDSVVVGLQIGIFLSLGIAMILAGKDRERYTRRIHLLTGFFCCVLACEYAIPFVFLEETMGFYYKGLSNVHLAKRFTVIGQIENIMTYPLLAMLLFSFFQAYRPIPFRTIFLPFVIPIALIIWTVVDFHVEVHAWAHDIFWIVYMFAMIALFISRIKGYRKYCSDNYSDTSIRNLKWLAGIPALLIPTVAFDFYVYGIQPTSKLLAIVSELSLLPVVIYLTYFAHKQIPTNEDSVVPDESSLVNSEEGNDSVCKTKSNHLQLSVEMQDVLTRLLEKECIIPQAYLDPQLTRSRLAVLLGTNNTYVSWYFASIGTNFNEFINGLRLEYACRMIEETKDSKDFSLKGIANSSGFANYRTFARLFVNKYGVSPTEWINPIPPESPLPLNPRV
ncbi:MAG: AraC family transcriptional regulator [Bacteroidales bacterium]|nr:AraC family transcriptional regulator [Bacteroidales bacterium]